MLKQRVITALILVIIVLADLFASQLIYWRGLITIVIALGFYEWLRFCRIESMPVQIAAFLLFCLSFYLVQKGYFPIEYVVPIICGLWVILLAFTLSNKLDVLHHKWLKLLIGLIILPVSGWLVIEIKTLDHGPFWVLGFLAAVAAADIGAYFSGKRFGKTKLAPSISPGKTVEGFLGGIVFVCLIATPILFSLFAPTAAALLLLTVLITVMISVGGDLFESKLKRYVGLKDSSQILPGHGGILDRIDSMLAGAPFYCCGLLLLGYLG